MLNFERRYDEAEVACTRGIELDSRLSRAYQTRGFSRSNLGKFDDAINDFSAALDMETDDRRRSMILYQRGYAKRLAGKYDEAFRDASQAVKLDETNPKARALMDSLELFVKKNQ